MTLLEYVVLKEEDINNVKTLSERYGYKDVKDYILCECCPSKFKCLKDTVYDIPYTKLKDDDYCKYNLEENSTKCNECWNREVLTM